MQPGLLCAVGGATSLVFALGFAWARRVRNFGVVDILWSAAFTPLAVSYAVTGDGPLWRRAGLAIVVTGWSGRLAVHLAQRVARLHPEEDARYVALRKTWTHALDRNMALFFQAQGLSAVALSWPFFLISRNAAAGAQPAELLGAALVIVGMAGETIADRQLATFKRGAAPGAVCERGLWRYSRHPNYFFEWLVWVGFAGAAWSAPYGWSAATAPAVMLYLLLCVTGIPATEAQLLRSKGAAYAAYRVRTSGFVPWFRRPEHLHP